MSKLSYLCHITTIKPLQILTNILKKKPLHRLTANICTYVTKLLHWNWTYSRKLIPQIM